MKKILIGSCLVFLIIGVVSFLFTKFFGPPSVGPPPSVSDLPTLSAPRKFPFDTSHIVFTYTGSSVSFPPSLPVYEAVYPEASPSAVTAFVRSLGITVPPKEVYPGVFDWEQGFEFVTFDKRSNHVSYSISPVEGNSNPQPRLEEKDVLSLFTSLEFLPSGSRLTRVSSRPFSGEGGISLDNQQVINLYRYVVGEKYPVILDAFDAFSETTQIESDSGKVWSFSFSLFPATFSPLKDVPILSSVGDIVASLNQGKGYLTEVSDEIPQYPARTTPSFTRVSIRSIVLSYFYSPETKTLVPLYSIEGQGGGAQTQTVHYLLRASL